MMIFEPTYTDYQGMTVATITNKGSVDGYVVHSETRLLGVYPNRASAEAAYDEWSDAQEGSTAPLKQPWKGITLPEVPDVDGGIASLIEAALCDEDVILVSSNGSDFFADNEAAVVLDVLENYRNYNSDWTKAPEDFTTAFAAVEYPSTELVQAIRQGFTPAHRIAALSELPLADIQEWLRSDARGDRELSPTGAALREAINIPEDEAIGNFLVKLGIITAREAEENEIGE